MKSNSPLRRKNSSAVEDDDSGTFFFVNKFSIHFGTETHRKRAPMPYETFGPREGGAMASVPASGAPSSADGGVASGAGAAGTSAGISFGAGGAPTGGGTSA